MNLTKFVIIENATKKPSFLATMENASQFYGVVILITTVETTVMSLHTFAETEIVQLVGAAVLVMPTTAAFPNGCSAMEKMIVEMDQTNFRKIVQLVKKKETLNAKIEDVFLNAGSAILRMIVVTTRTSKRICAVNKATENALNPNFDV